MLGEIGLSEVRNVEGRNHGWVDNRSFKEVILQGRGSGKGEKMLKRTIWFRPEKEDVTKLESLHMCLEGTEHGFYSQEILP